MDLPVHRSLAAAVILFVSLSFAAPALRAGTVEVEFDLTGSTLSALGGHINVPPDGTITSGMVRMRMPGTGLTAVSPGPARISAFSLGLTVDALLSGALVTGTASMTQNGVANGSLTTALVYLAATSPFRVSATGTFECTGVGCAAFGTFPVTFNGIQTIGPPASFALGSLHAAGQATARGTLLMMLGSHTAVLGVVGNEISRTFVPEPGWPWHAALLAGSLVVFSRLRRS
jgi:hypothetical protein